MCSTSTDEKDIERATSLGASGYVTKPPRMNKLKPIVDQMQYIYLQQSGDEWFLMRRDQAYSGLPGRVEAR